MIKMRGHHLVCLQYFEGKGYSMEFIENLAYIEDSLEEGEEVKIVSGPDDVCRSCPHLAGSRCNQRDDSEEKIRTMDREIMKQFGTREGDKLNWRDVKEKFSLIERDRWREYCRGCSWEKICHG